MPAYNGRARVNPRNPQASAVCDRCGFLNLHVDLRYDQQYVGPRMVTTRFLVCPTCRDVPNPSNRTIILAPDPPTIKDPRPEPYAGEQPDVFTTQDGTPFSTETGLPVVKENGA